MSETIREKWNQRYTEDQERLREADAFLLSAHARHIAPVFASRGDALDLAGGRGRHALWLAQQGWRVTMTDISDVGVEDARQAASTMGLDVKFVTCDSLAFPFVAESYDLVVVFLYLERALFPNIEAALRPGGFLVYKTYTVDHYRFGKAGETWFFLQRGELRDAFPSLEVLEYEEADGAAKLVARKVV